MKGAFGSTGSGLDGRARVMLRAMTAAMFAVMVMAAGAWAAVTWSLNGGTLTISGTGNMTNYSSDGAPWRSSGASITSVVINDGVTSIGNYAFFNCSGLTSLTIPDGVTYIGDYAFSYCSGLTGSLTIPDGVTYIGNRAFYNCSGLTGALTIPDGVTSIGDGAFQHCSGLTSVTIPNGVTSFGSYAFSDCSGLTSITIPNGVTSFGFGMFRNCTGLTSLTIPDGVTSIIAAAFEGCSGLMSLTIPNGVTSIGAYAFSGCSGLMSLTIPDGVTSIGELAFSGCSVLTSVISLSVSPPTLGSNVFYNVPATCVTVPPDSKIDYETVTWGGFTCFNGDDMLVSQSWDCGKNGGANVKATLTFATGTLRIDGSGAMENYDNFLNVPWYRVKDKITQVIIGDGVTSIGDRAFEGYSWLTSVTIPDGLETIGHSAFSGCSGLTLLTIPDGVTSISGFAFNECSGLTSITIPDGVISIEQSAFQRCRGLTSITIPNGVTSIGDGAFYDCSGLTSITIPDGVTSIGELAFYSCSGLTSLTIPDGVTSIGVGAFDGCTYLMSVTSLAVSPPVLGSGVFANVSSSSCLYVPEVGVEAYNSADIWKDFRCIKSLEEYASVLTPDRVIPNSKPDEGATVVAPAGQLSGEFTAGPNPVGREFGSVGFFRQGKRVSSGELRIYDATGNVIGKVQISDNVLGNQARRKVGSWDLTDKSGRLVSEGTYLIKGVLKTSDGKKEKVSLIVGVR